MAYEKIWYQEKEEVYRVCTVVRTMEIEMAGMRLKV